MAGMANWQAQISIDIDDLKKRIKVAEGELDKIEKKEHKVKLDIDTKTLENAVIKLDRMLESLGKGSGDFKEFENLSKQLSSITTDINNISKAFSVMNDGSDFANSIKSIDTSLTALSNHFVSEMSGRMTSSIKEVKSTLSDVGDGGELAPLLQTINKIENAINELSTSVKGIGFNMNIDVGSNSEMEAKVQSKIANALQAYQRLFDAIKMSGAGGSVINTNFFEFDINQYDTMMGKLQAYKKFIDNMRNEAKTQYNGKDILYQSVDKTYWTQASAAMGQVTKAFNEMNASSDTNPLKDLFGSGDLSEVISQLGLIVAKLEEISTTASSFKNVFKEGFNVNASVEEIDKLTNRVKELEDELAKIKLNPVSVDKSNISSDNFIRSVLPSDSEFKNVIANLDLTKSKLSEIVKITRQAHADKDGKFYESFTLTDRYGSTETYGESSKTSKGQLLNYKYVEQNAKAVEQETKAVQKLAEEKRKLRQQEKQSTQSSVDKALKDQVSAWKQIQSIREKIAKTNNTDEIAALQESKKYYQEQYNNANKILKANDDLYDKEAQIARLEQVRLETNAKLASYKTKQVESLESTVKGYYKDYDNRNTKPNNENRSVEYQQALDKYLVSIKELEVEKNRLSQLPFVSDKELSKFRELEQIVQENANAFKAMSAAQKGSTEASRWKEIDKISKYLEKNTRLSKEAKQQLQEYITLLKSGSAVNIEDIHRKFNEIAVAERIAGREGKNFFDIFSNKVVYGLAAKLAMYYLSFYDFIRYARNAINAVKELDTALIDLKKTTTMSSSDLEQFYYDSNDVAKQLGVTTAEIINQASAWSRLGFSTKEASTQMAELSAQFASISPDMDLDTATDGLVSSMKAFDIEVSNVERDIMDNINRIGNTAATSNGEIVDMLTRSSAAMAAANNTIQETIALETAAVEITRNAESTGTAFKTLSMRIRGRQTLPPYTVMYMLCA